MRKKVLITGISGFAGSHLAEYILVQEEQYEVHGTYLSEKSLINLEGIQKNLSLVRLNLLDEKNTIEFIKTVKPDFIFHLAAIPTVANSFSTPAETITNNIIAQLNILEAARISNLYNSRILIISSADVYGKVSDEYLPINEQTPFTPTNSYAVSKIAQDFLGMQYFISYNLPIIRARPFNHIGPRQPLGFVISDFAKKIVGIEKGRADSVLQVGNLSAKRDFTDVRDMVRAYYLLINKGDIGDVYNIGSGVSHKISDMLDILLSYSKVKIKIEVDDSLLRPKEAQERICDNSKIKNKTGWRPTISLYKTLKDTLDYWRDIV